MSLECKLAGKPSIDWERRQGWHEQPNANMHVCRLGSSTTWPRWPRATIRYRPSHILIRTLDLTPISQAPATPTHRAVFVSSTRTELCEGLGQSVLRRRCIVNLGG